MAKWILTREGADGDDVELLLRARGHEALRVPCIETRWHAWPWKPDSRALTLFTSRRAVESFARNRNASAQRTSTTRASVDPEVGAIAAVSPQTSRALTALGLEPNVEASGGTMALVEAIVAAWPGIRPVPRRIRYPTSSAGVASPEQAEAVRVLSTLAVVDRAIVYDVAPPSRLGGALNEALRDPSQRWSIVFASPSAVTHFFGASPAPTHAPAHAICFGASTARAWDEQRPPAWPIAAATTDLRSTLEVIT